MLEKTHHRRDDALNSPQKETQLAIDDAKTG